MPLNYPRQTIIPVVIREEGDQNFTFDWLNKFNLIETTAPMNLTLNANVTSIQNAEIIIRNYYNSTDNITIVQGNEIDAIDVSGDLGLVIPPGGIGELKRIGGANAWSFYGYIEA